MRQFLFLIVTVDFFYLLISKLQSRQLIESLVFRSKTQGILNKHGKLSEHHHLIDQILRRCVPASCRKYGQLCGNDQFRDIHPQDHHRIQHILNYSYVSLDSTPANRPLSHHHDSELNGTAPLDHQNKTHHDHFNRTSPQDHLRHSFSCVNYERAFPINIGIVTTWTGNHPLNFTLLNQFLYSQYHHYHFFHGYFTSEEWEARHDGKYKSPGWSSVEYVLELMENYPNIHYFFKVDIDCLFATYDLKLESIIDPFQQYSFYLTSIVDSRFIQSHTWIVRNNAIGQNILKQWLFFRDAGKCTDLAQEQGALNLVVGRLMQQSYANTTSEYNCDNFCYSMRTAYKHYHCVFDWYTDNNMSTRADHSWLHPFIYLYPFLPNKNSFLSPNDGFSDQVTPNTLSKYHEGYLPLTVHPCKKYSYIPPSEVLQYINVCNT